MKPKGICEEQATKTADAYDGNWSKETLDMKAFLHDNFEPWSTIKESWARTCEIRMAEIRINDFDTVLANWPRLKKQMGYELVDIDFSHLHSGAASKLKSLWPKYVRRIVNLAYQEAKRKKDKSSIDKFKIKDNNEDEEQNLVGLLGLQAIFYLCPNKNKVTKQSFNVLFRKTENRALINEEVQKISEERAAKKMSLNPFVLYFEDEKSMPCKFFVCINHLVYEVGMFITALDTLVKSFFVFDLAYPEEGVNTLTFIQHFFLQIYLSTDIESNMINSLMCDIDLERSLECETLMLK